MTPNKPEKNVSHNGHSNGNHTTYSTENPVGTGAKKGNGTQSGTNKSFTAKSTKKGQGLHTLLQNGIKEIYNAEKQLVKALPEIAKAAYDDELLDAIYDHYRQTQKHQERLERVFVMLRMNAEEKRSSAVQGLIDECTNVVNDYELSLLRDAALVIALQKIEHFEIAAYGSLCELADVLGYPRVADVLERTLREEEEADHILASIVREINDENHYNSSVSAD